MQFSDIATLAHNLLGSTPVALAPVDGGRNAVVTRVETADGTYALKRYMRADAARRLAMEAKALTFLNREAIPDVPRLVGRNDECAVLAMTWLEGERVTAPGDADIHACTAFLRRLRDAARAPSARALDDAKEACGSVAAILEQIDARISRFAGVARYSKPLDDFLETAIQPRRRGLEGLRIMYPDPFPQSCRTLSPSDFGLHNAVRRFDGGLSFFDFEYFGWDDPVKLVADFLLHPGMPLSRALRDRFAAEMRDVFADVPAYDERLAELLPAFRLRWALIMLNPVLDAAAESGHEGDAFALVVARETGRAARFLGSA